MSRKANGDGSLTQRKDGRWEYKLCIGVDCDGKIIRKSFYGKTKSEAKQKGRDFLSDNTPKVEKSMTVGQWAIQWLENYKKDKIEYGSYRNHEMYVNNHIIPVIGQYKLDQVKPVHIEKLLHDRKDLSASALKHIKITLNGIFETALDNNLCLTSPMRKIKVNKKDSG